MGKENSKALLEEVTEGIERMDVLNEELEMFKENVCSLNQIIKLERQLKQARTGIFYQPLLLAEDYFNSKDENNEQSDKSLLSDMTSMGLAGAELGTASKLFSVSAGGIIAAGAGGLIYAIDQAIGDAIETMEKESEAFQSVLGERLRGAFSKQANGIAEGVSLAAL